MNKFFEVKDVTFSSSKEHRLVDVNFSIKKQGQIISILGPSGVGKTTILRAIAGLDPITEGEILLNKKVISSTSIFIEPEKRDIALSFQENSLFPHLNVFENLKIGQLKRTKKKIKLSLEECIEAFFLNSILKKYPHEISAGEAQRASLTRSLISKPSLLLLDEPFSNVDIGLKEKLQVNLKTILKKNNISSIIVTHNYEEAFYLGEKCCLFAKGKLIQFDNPYNIYHFPASQDVASFFNKGTFVTAKVISKNELSHKILGKIKGSFVHSHEKGKNVKLLIQPEDLIHNDKSKLKFKIIDKRFEGTNFIYFLRVSQKEILPVLVHSHHMHQHSINEFFGVKTPIIIKHLVCF
ncbi:MAG: ABC transporter ATP-binding protein [Pelagibacteraceae bacterium TMED124]|nr:iron ABC transporter [Rickettsiales bacterium]RPG19360.1 MAG: ABC transporter ATP-binding protein [Pelagibacteraceae bacterium TMED124]|tara:strand:+ start:506 stop:1561 length:1056 start_codon:yes stop_codon:yes gene_type:complete